MNYKMIKERLLELAEDGYREFSASLTPGKDNILGVRLPALRKLAKEIAKGDFRQYLKEAKDDTFEEVMLQGMVIGACKADIEEVLHLTANFIPKIDNWAVCDSFCSSLKITKKHLSRVWDFLIPYLSSDQEFEIRFGLVMLLNYYVLPEYAQAAFEYLDRIHHDGYYVKMGLAWAISIYFIKMPEVTMNYLQKNQLDEFTYHKALQKILDSYRVDNQTKMLIRAMKRHK